jgi:RNA polymerase sigma factor (sigma-70 family)
MDRVLQNSPITRVSLLIRLRDTADHSAWQQFAELYGPVIYRFARGRGLQDADAADVMQDTLRSVSNAIGRLDYDSAKGSFRGWLFTIARNKIFNLLSSRKNKPRAAGDTAAHELLQATPSDDNSLEESWEDEYRRRLAGIAIQRIKGEFQPNTWEAFWGTAVNGESATDVGERLGMSSGAVYVAKSRVLARLKEQVQRLIDEEDQ